MFIDFEGVDGTGKGTLIPLLQDYLVRLGRKVVMAKEPGGTELGLEIRQLLFHKITTLNMAPGVCDCLFLADHLQNVEKIIKPALTEVNTDIISDRYAFSQFAYSVDREVPPSIDRAYRDLIGPIPDLIFLLTGTAEHLLERAQGRTTETHQEGKKWNNADSQRRIQDQYYRLLINFPQTVIVPTDILKPEEIYERYIQPAVDKYFSGGILAGQIGFGITNGQQGKVQIQ